MRTATLANRKETNSINEPIAHKQNQLKLPSQLERRSEVAA